MTVARLSVSQQRRTTRGPPNVAQVIQEIAFCGLDCGLENALPIRQGRTLDNLRRPWLENPRAPCPTGHVSLEERGEVFSYGWKFSASATDLRKVEGHYGVDEPDHDEFSTAAGRESIRRNDGDPLPSLDHRDLCIQIIHGESGLICDAGLCEASVYKLLQRNG